MSTGRILALDTTTEACSVALSVDGRIVHRWERLPRGHAARILPMVDEVLAEADCRLAHLDAVAFCRGPGSFTGVRICAGVAQGMAYASDRPVVPVSTLATIAQGAQRAWSATAVLAALDARMGQVYWGAFRADAEGVAAPVTAEVVCDPDRVPLPDGGGWTGAGTGFDAYGEMLRDRLGERLARMDPARLADARDCLTLAARAVAAGEVVAAVDAMPVYLRDRVAERPSR